MKVQLLPAPLGLAALHPGAVAERYTRTDCP